MISLTDLFKQKQQEDGLTKVVADAVASQTRPALQELLTSPTPPVIPTQQQVSPTLQNVISTAPEITAPAVVNSLQETASKTPQINPEIYGPVNKELPKGSQNPAGSLAQAMQSFGYGMFGKPITDRQPSIWDYAANTLGRFATTDLTQGKIQQPSSFAAQVEEPQLKMKAKYASRVATEEYRMAKGAEIADAIINGLQPPDLGRMYGYSGPVRIALAEKGFNLSKATSEWNSTQKAIAGLNSTAQIRLRQTLDSVSGGIEPMRQLSDEFDRIGFKPANALIVKAGLNGITLKPSSIKNATPDQVQIVTKYITQMNTMRDELAQAFSGGYAPTDASFKLADEVLNPAYSNPQLGAALDQLAVNLRIRKMAVENVTPLGGFESKNPYWQRESTDMGATKLPTSTGSAVSDKAKADRIAAIKAELANRKRGGK